jgi:ABC-type sugar transport system substrate-binding protein
MKAKQTTKDGPAFHKSRRAFLGTLSLALPAGLLLTSACNRGGGKGDKFVIGFSQANKAEPWRTWMDDTLMKEAAHHLAERSQAAHRYRQACLRKRHPRNRA